MSAGSADVLAFEKELSGKSNGFVKQAYDLQNQAQKDDMHQREDPLSEEHLRIELHDNDPDLMSMLHSYYQSKGFGSCKRCGASLSLDNEHFTNRQKQNGSEFNPNEAMYGDPAIFGNGVSFATSGYLGSQRIGAFLRYLAKKLEEGWGGRELEAEILRFGFVNKVGDYIRAARIIHDDNMFKKTKSQSSVGKTSNNGGHKR